MRYIDVIKEKYGKSGQITDYLSVKDNLLYYKELEMTGLVKQYGDPLEIGYTEIITERISALSAHFKKASDTYGYQGKFIYAYASKANYYSEVLVTALQSVQALEVTSSYDLDIVEFLHADNVISKEFPILCNGFKYERYFKKICALRAQGFNIMPILENEEELRAFIARPDLGFDIGMRLNVAEDLLKGIDSSRASSYADSRFGFSFEDMQRLAKEVSKSKNLTFKLFHFHFGGSIEDLSVYKQLVEQIYREQYCALRTEHPTLQYFDIGGGVPTAYDLSFNFDYQKYADALVEMVVNVSNELGVPHADIISECGRYTVNDHGCFCMRIVLTKPTAQEDTMWYFINGSLMNFLPDSWALGQKFIILPLNGWDREATKVRLGGITCDPDDTYYKHEEDNYIYLPKMEEGEPLYIGFFGVGAYQEMISGVGGVHHCLLPEGNELIIYRKDGELAFDRITLSQPPEKVLKILDYHGLHRLGRYKRPLVGVSHEVDQEKFGEFHAEEYLKNYYAEADLGMVRTYVTQKTAGAETMRIMTFLEEVCVPLVIATHGRGAARLLELGGGPTLYQLMALAPVVKEIVFTDYVEDNLDAVRRWRQKEDPHFDWKSFLRAAVMIRKDSPSVTEAEVLELEDELRHKIVKTGHCDIFKEDLGLAGGVYDVINTHFVAESATRSKEEWQKTLTHMYSKLAHNGLLFMSTLRGAKGSYKVLDGEFPAVELHELDIEEGLKQAGFEVIRITSIHSEDVGNNYEGFMFVVAQKE